MIKFTIITLFIIGALFMHASHILVWLLGGGKPTHPYWKSYGIIGIVILILVLILANTVL